MIVRSYILIVIYSLWILFEIKFEVLFIFYQKLIFFSGSIQLRKHYFHVLFRVFSLGIPHFVGWVASLMVPVIPHTSKTFHQLVVNKNFLSTTMGKKKRDTINKIYMIIRSLISLTRQTIGCFFHGRKNVLC